MYKLSLVSFFTLLSCLAFSDLYAQPITIDGYAFESDNRGYLNEVRVYILDVNSGDIITQGASDMDGHFQIDIPAGQYILSAEKDLFQPYTKTISTEGVEPGGKMFEKVQLYRKPGYIFDVTLARVRDSIDAPTDGVNGAWIEIYNNTTEETIFNLKDYPHPHFKFTFEKGNYYTMLVRHKDYFTKRLEAHVDVDGCILCFEGIGDIRPSVTDNLTAGLEMGTLLTNIELQPANIGDKITLNNIYYNYNKSIITDKAASELDKLIQVLRDNPAIIIELSSHTDSRGDKKYNNDLSFARAKSAVQYLVAHGIESRRIQPRGYGEHSLVNDCSDGVDCTEEQHQENRRTELKVLGFLSEDPLANKTLAQIKEDERFEQMLLEVQNQTVVQVQSGDELPDEIKKEMKSEDVVDDVKVQEADKVVEASENNGNVVSEEIRNEVEEAKNRVQEASENLSKMDSEDEVQVENMKKAPKMLDKEITDSDAIVMPNENSNPVLVAYSSSPYIEIIPNDYSGFKVQILSANNPVDSEHTFFISNKKVYVEKKEKGFAYLLGHYDTREGASNYLESNVKKKYTDAFIVHYINGVRQ